MADLPEQEPDSGKGSARHDQRGYRWQVLFQRCREAVFLINRQRRLVFVNRAWEELTGRPAAAVRGLACKRHKEPESGSWEALANVLSPPAEVHAGRPGRARRLLPAGEGRRWCDLDFFPIADEQGTVAVLGRITPVAADAAPAVLPLPEELAGLREAQAQRYRWEFLGGSQPGASAALRRLEGQGRLASQTRVPVLIVGEPGTGKQWLARTIHYQGPAHETAFVAVDCAHLPPAVLAGMLFGDGGLAWRSGVGTLYFREPGRLPRDLQDRLAALITDSGDRGPRVMAGSRLDPAEEVRAGQLRDDLYCALATLVLELPPLRNRPAADLPWLVERLLQRAAGDAPGTAPGLTPEAWELVYSYRWPGNVAELYAVLQNAWARAGGGPEVKRLDAADLPAFLRLAGTPGRPAVRSLPLAQLLEEAERRLIALALRMTQGNKSRAADVLSIWRPYLIRRMKKLGMADAGEGKP
jgi:DNA-binding NtrC family response regulator